MRSAKEIAAGLRELHTNNDDTRTFLRTAADYIERSAAPVDGLVLPPMRRSYIEGTIPPEFRPDPDGPYVLWDDAAAALAAANERAASEKKRADEAEERAHYATGTAEANIARANEAEDERDREAAARREAEARAHKIAVQSVSDINALKARHQSHICTVEERAKAREATLRAALEKIHRSLDAEISMHRCACPHPCEDYLMHPGPCGTRTAESLRNIDVIARAALATNSTMEGS